MSNNQLTKELILQKKNSNRANGGEDKTIFGKKKYRFARPN